MLGPPIRLLLQKRPISPVLPTSSLSSLDNLEKVWVWHRKMLKISAKLPGKWSGNLSSSPVLGNAL